MNSLYIGVGTAIILALVAALIGPAFVDWGAHRAVFETQASRAIGLPVRILGDIDLRLLPSPRVRAGDVVIGDLARPVARVGRFAANIDAAGLVRGEVRVAEAILDRPVIDVAVDADGRIAGLPRVESDLGAVTLEALRLVDGRATLSDTRSGARLVVGRLDGLASAERLAGPWRLDATAEIAGRAATLRLAGHPTDAGTAMRGLFVLPDLGVSIGGDLTTTVADGPRLGGSLNLDRRGAGVPWRVTATLDGDTSALTFTDVVATVGDDLPGGRFEGDVKVTLGATPTAEARLAARRLDLDPPPTGKPDAPAPVSVPRLRWPALLGEVVAALPAAGSAVATRLDLRIDAIGSGGAQIGDLRLEAQSRADGLSIDRLTARLPGETRLDVAGRLRLDGAATLAGRGEIASRAPEVLAAWWAGESATDSRFGPVALSGPFTVTSASFLGEDLTLTLGGGTAHGRIEHRADGGTRVALSADRLDGEALARLARRFGLAEAAAGRAFLGDLEIDFDARAVALGAATARGARVALRLSGDALAIDALEIADLAGARIQGGGRIDHVASTPDGALDLAVAAEAPGAAARALAAVFGDADAADRAERFGRAVGPLDLRLRLEGRAGAQGNEVRLGLGGRAAGGTAKGEATYTGRVDDLSHGVVTATLSLDGGRLDPLLATSIGATAADRLGLAGSIAGRAVDGLRFDLAASAGAGHLRIGGSTVAAVDAPMLTEVTAEATVPDLPLLATAIGRPGLVYERRLPLSARFSARGGAAGWEVADLAATLGDATVTAAGRIDLAGPRHRFTGTTRIDRADLDLLADWFGAAGDGRLLRVVDLDVATTIDHLSLGAMEARAVTGRVVDGDGETRLDGIDGQIGSARFGGDVRVRRRGGGLAVAGRGHVDGMAIGGGVPPAVSATASVEIVAEASGRDPAALPATATGSGRVVLDDVRLAGIDPAGLRMRHDDVAVSGVASARRLTARMAPGEMRLPRIELPVLIDHGTVSTVRTVIDAMGARIDGRAAFDMTSGALSGTWTLEPRGEGARIYASAVSQAMPSVDLTLGGPVAAPRLGFETSTWDAFQTLYRLEKEIETAETTRQDQIERTRFARLLRRLDEARRAREAEAAAARAAASAPSVGQVPSVGPAAPPSSWMPPAPESVGPARP